MQLAQHIFGQLLQMFSILEHDLASLHRAPMLTEPRYGSGEGFRLHARCPANQHLVDGKIELKKWHCTFRQTCQKAGDAFCRCAQRSMTGKRSCCSG